MRVTKDNYSGLWATLLIDNNFDFDDALDSSSPRTDRVRRHQAANALRFGYARSFECGNLVALGAGDAKLMEPLPLNVVPAVVKLVAALVSATALPFTSLKAPAPMFRAYIVFWLKLPDSA
jgi:hypothetical protein